MNSKIAGAPNLNSLGQWLKTTRRAAKLSQTVLGARAGLSRMPVYRLEAGQDISLASFLALLTALQQHMELKPTQTDMLRAQDLAQAFSHLQEDER
jgi:transcriptional regulator with XRE-family HTH domain